MRFFAHDGQTVHGPSRVDELTKLPNFDGDTLVCPVGSENSADWKPALAYPPFRAVLLAPAPRTAAPPRVPAPIPAPPPPTAPCPRCAQRNPEKARFCNDCGARMDGREQAPPMAAAPPAPAFPAAAPAELAAPAALEAPPPAEPPPPISFEALASSAPYELPPDSFPAPIAFEPPPAPAPAGWRKPLIAAFVGALIAGSGLGWWLLRPAVKRAAPGAELNLTPPAPSAPAPAMESPQSAPISAPPAAATPAPPPPVSLPAPMAPAAAAPVPAVKAAAPKPAAPRRPRAKRAKPFKAVRAAQEKIPAPPPEKAAEAAPAKPADVPAAKPDDAPTEPADGFLLPGVPRRLPTSKKAPRADAAAAKEDAPAAEPAAPDRAEDPSAGQVREQFEFCSQLLSQGAYADHFDTCLCAGAKQAPAFRGDRKRYAAAMKKLAEAGALETKASAGGIVLDGSSAKVTAGKTTQNWSLEDGLWCRAQ